MDWMDVLTKALKLEQDGREFYLKASMMSADAESKAMFRTLADDELSHYNFLQREYASLLCDEVWCEIPELDDVEPIDLKAPIFPAGMERPKELGDTPGLENVLLFALDAEDKSFHLYKQSAEQAPNESVKELFTKLAAAEMGHFSLIMQRYESYFAYPR